MLVDVGACSWLPPATIRARLCGDYQTRNQNTAKGLVVVIAKCHCRMLVMRIPNVVENVEAATHHADTDGFSPA